MKWLSVHNVDIGLTLRFLSDEEADEENGGMYVYLLDMNLPIGDKLYIWAMYIVPEKIKYLQKYVKIGIAAGKKKLNELNEAESLTL